MRVSEDRYRRWLVGLVLVGAALRLTGLNWDGGRGLHPDEGNLVRAALALSVPDRMIPEFHAYNDLSLWLPRIVALPFCVSGDAGCLTWAARLVSACFAIAAIPLAAALARLLAGPAAGLAAACAIATSAPLIQWAHFGTTESVLVFLILGLWLICARWLTGRTGDRNMALWSGVLIGVGFGFKTTALVGAVIPLTALAIAGVPDLRRLGWVARGGLLALLTALVLAPSVWAATDAWLAVMRFEGNVVTGTRPVFWTAQFADTRAGWYQLRQLLTGLTFAGLPLALAGLGVLAYRPRRAALPGLVFAAVYVALTFGWEAKFFRYLAPLIPVLLVLAAVGVGHLTARRYGRTVPALALAGLGLMALGGIDQASVYLREDPRLRAERALRAAADPGDLVAVGPNDVALSGSLNRTVLPLAEGPIDTGALARQIAQADWMLIASRRNWSVLPRHGPDPARACAFYAALASGTLGYLTVRRFDRNGPFGALFAPGMAAEETRAVFDRPMVLLLRNEAGLSADAIAGHLADTPAAADCAPATLSRQWRAPR